MGNNLNEKAGKFKQWIQEVNARPSITDRLKHSGTDFLLTVVSLQLSDLLLEKSISLNGQAGNLLEQSGKVLDAAGAVMTNGQMDVVITLQHNAATLMRMGESMNNLSWAAVGVGMLAALQLSYNGVIAGIETFQEIKRNF